MNNELTWHVPPRNAGQIVEVAYAADDEGIYRRTTDRSDGTVTVEYADWSALDDSAEFEPWNHEPEVSGWGTIPARKLSWELAEITTSYTAHCYGDDGDDAGEVDVAIRRATVGGTTVYQVWEPEACEAGEQVYTELDAARTAAEAWASERNEV